MGMGMGLSTQKGRNGSLGNGSINAEKQEREPWEFEMKHDLKHASVCMFAESQVPAFVLFPMGITKFRHRVPFVLLSSFSNPLS